MHGASPTALAAEIDAAAPGRFSLVAAFAVARDIATLAAREVLMGTPTQAGSARFREYLLQQLGSRQEECVLVIFLSGNGLYIAEDFYAGVQRDFSVLPLRRTIRRAFDLDAHRIVLAHNHPSGDARPSRADIRATQHFASVAQALEFIVEDHFIVANGHATSMRDMRLI